MTRLINQKLRLLFLLLSSIPVMVCGATFTNIYNLGGDPNKLNVIVEVSGDADYVTYSIVYEDGMGNVTDETYTENVQGYGLKTGIEMD